MDTKQLCTKTLFVCLQEELQSDVNLNNVKKKK